MKFKKIFPVIFIVILVVSTASVFAQAAKKTCVVTVSPEEAAKKKMFFQSCPDDLGLTPEQQAKMIDIKFDHKIEMLSVKRDLLKKGIELRAEMEKENPDKAVLDKIADETALLQARMKKSGIRCVLAVKALLGKEQWLKARERIMDECMGGDGCRERFERESPSFISISGEEEPDMTWQQKEKRIKIIKMGDEDEPIVIRTEEDDD